MKRFPAFAMVLLALSALWFLAGCSTEESHSDGSAVSDEEALAQLVEEDTELETVNAWAGEDDDAMTDGGGLDDPIRPLRWGRVGQWRRERVSVEMQGDTLATITRVAHFTGTLRLLADTTGGQRTVITKRMHNVLTRRFRAVRVDRTPNPRRNWHIAAVTPELLESADPNPNTVDIARVQIYRSGANDTLPALIADVENPLRTWFRRGSLPAVAAGDEIIVYATVRPANPVLGFLHPRAFTMRPHPRLALNDAGEGHDVLAGDGIYTGSYTPPMRGGVFQAGVDMIDHETIYDSEYPYDATGWAIPYRMLNN